MRADNAILCSENNDMKHLLILPLLLLLISVGFSCKPDEPGPKPDPSVLDFQQFLGHTEQSGNLIPNLMMLLPNDHVVLAYTTFTQDNFGNQKEQDIHLAKYDITGKKLWDRLITNKFVNFCTDIQPASDGGFLLAGSRAADEIYYYNSFIYLAKTDSGGNVLWEKTFESAEQGLALSVTEGGDGRYYLLGEKAKTRETFVFVLSPSGDLLARWNLTESYYSSSIPYGSVQRISATRDGNILLYGSVVCKLSPIGQTLWVASVSTPDELVTLRSMLEDAEGKYVMTGESSETLSGNFRRSVPFIIIDGSGVVSTSKKIAFPDSYEAFANHIYEKAPNDYMLAGTLVGSDNHHLLALASISGLGVVKWNKTFDYSMGFQTLNMGAGVARFSNGSYVATGITYRITEGNPEYRKTVLLKWRKPD